MPELRRAGLTDREMLKMMNTQKMWQWEERGRMAWVAGLLMQAENKTEQIYNELQAGGKSLIFSFFPPFCRAYYLGLVEKKIPQKVGWLSSCLRASKGERKIITQVGCHYSN